MGLRRGGGGGEHAKKWLSRGPSPKKIREKGRMRAVSLFLPI